MIYHVAVHSDWHDAIVSGDYRVSTLGSTLGEVGFIHASERNQVAATAERFYRGQRDLVVLVIDEELVAADGVEIRREDAGNGELFPHIFGAIKPRWVVAVEDL